MRIGRLIQQPTGYKAFVPDKFPPDQPIVLNTKTQQLYAKAVLMLGKLDGITQLLPDLDFFILMYITKEATRSSEIGLSQFDVLGISSGAPYSYAIGYKFPDQVRNLFILSGTPALYDETVLSFWPYPVQKNASMTEMQKLAYELFFSHLSKEDLAKDEIKDSMMNDCFGIAQDLKLRCIDWGFQLSDVNGRVYMRHSKSDNSVPLITAEMTSKLLSNCQLYIREIDVHFSQEVLDHFISTVMTGYYVK